MARAHNNVAVLLASALLLSGCSKPDNWAQMREDINERITRLQLSLRSAVEGPKQMRALESEISEQVAIDEAEREAREFDADDTPATVTTQPAQPATAAAAAAAAAAQTPAPAPSAPALEDTPNN
jgi:hypothetical protein